MVLATGQVGTVADSDLDNLADAGETITYAITVTNTGNVRMSDVKVRHHDLNVASGPGR